MFLCYNHGVESKRLIYYDLLKALLIVLVVLGHVFEIFIDNGLIKSAYLTIYSFHMPLFVFISGFFARWEKSRFFAYLIMFVVFSIVPKFGFSLITNSITLKSVLDSILSPSWGMWFLLVLPFWNLSLLVVKKVKLNHVAISIAIALVVGFIPCVGEVLSLGRMFYFFPFFLTGKLCGQNKDKFNQFIEQSQTLFKKFISVIILLTTLMVFVFIFNDASIDLFYGKAAYLSPSDCLIRLLCLEAGFLNGLAFMILIPLTNDYSPILKSFSLLGKKTLSIYIFHIFVLTAVKELCKCYLPIELSSNLFFILSFSVSLTIIVVFITSRKFFVKIVDFFLKRVTKHL